MNSKNKKQKCFASLPLFALDNPFQIPWIYAMEGIGWEAKPMIWWPISLIKHRNKIPIIMFHFPNTYWRKKNLYKAIFFAWLFRIMVNFGKLLNYKFVWTAHNLLPHDPDHLKLEMAQRRWILKNFDLIIGLAKNTKTNIEEKFGKIEIGYTSGVIGHYEGLFPENKSEDILIEEFGLDKSKYRIMLLLSAKPYKGQIDFLRVWQDGNYPNLQLVLAGKMPQNFIQKFPTLKGNVAYLFSTIRVPHNILGDIHRACNMVALPYKKITTSAAYMLAVTLERPVLVPDLDFFVMHKEENHPISVLYNNLDSLKTIEEKLNELNKNGFFPMRESFLKLKEKYSWTNFAKDIEPELNKLLQ